MTRQRTLLVAVLALLIASAGCSSIGSQVSPTDGPTATEGTDATPTDGPTVRTDPTQTATTTVRTDTSPTATHTKTAGGPDPGAVRSRAIDAMEAVATYRVGATESRTVVANLERELSIEQDVAVDREAGDIHVDATQSTATRSVEVDIYLLEDTLYQRNPAFARQFSTEWVEVDTIENVTQVRRALDPLKRHQRILEVSDVAYNGTETIDGTEVYRLETASGPERLEDLFAEQVTGPGSGLNESTYSVSNATFTFWISAETDRPVEVTGRIESTISGDGQSVSLGQSFSFEYDYDAAVSIELPEEANSAVKLSEALNESSGA